MELDTLRPLYDQSGPFVTVYLEGRSSSADARQQLRLRWNALREQLLGDGAANSALSAIDDALSVEETTEVHTDGRVIVADSDTVLLDEPWDAAVGAGDAAHVGDQPVLGAYVRELSRAITGILVVADQSGALVREIRVAPQHDAVDSSETHIEGEEDDQSRIHKPREGALSHNQIRRHADELIKENAREVAEHVGKLVQKSTPDVIAIAGEVQGRTAVKSELPTAAAELAVEISRGGIVDDAAEAALYEELQTLAAEFFEKGSVEDGEALSRGKAHDLVVEGETQVAKVAERGAVETLLLNYESKAEQEDEILAAVIRSSGGVSVTDADLAEGIAAILRFDVAAALAD